jgi:hypothetical protein
MVGGTKLPGSFHFITTPPHCILSRWVDWGWCCK